jgi:N-acetylglucosaminyldiphosphoundecaprenol N-acetyl-beta-D-mannosaminyltransferase
VGGEDLANNELDWNVKSHISQYNIILVNFGAPEQEQFIYSLKGQENAKIKLAIGVGGSFDFLTGKVKRAPAWMRSIGLEWLFRLIQQPNRWKRIWNAVVIFPIKVLFSK